MHVTKPVVSSVDGVNQRTRGAAVGSMEPADLPNSTLTPPLSGVRAREIRAPSSGRGTDGVRGKSLFDAELSRGQLTLASEQQDPDAAEFRYTGAQRGAMLQSSRPFDDQPPS